MLLRDDHMPETSIPMNNYTIRQGDVSATLSEVSYSPVSSDIENNTPYVIEDFISADADRELTTGGATIHYNGNTYPVLIEVWPTPMSNEQADGEDEDGDEETEPTFSIEITPTEGTLPRLADMLGLLEEYSKQQKAALLSRCS